MDGEELKLHQLAHHQLMSLQILILVHTVKLKTMIKAQISGRMVSSGISDVAFASVYSENTCLKKCWIMIIIIMKNLQETMVFRVIQKLTSAMKQKVMVDFKFDALYR